MSATGRAASSRSVAGCAAQPAACRVTASRLAFTRSTQGFAAGSVTRTSRSAMKVASASSPRSLAIARCTSSATTLAEPSQIAPR